MQVVVTKKAAKQYRDLPKIYQVRIKKKMSLLKIDPLEGKKLSGEYGELRSLRVWPYRIIYYIDGVQNNIVIITIAHRQGVYK